MHSKNGKISKIRTQIHDGARRISYLSKSGRETEPDMARKPILLIIGPTPPPYHGVAVATQAMLESGIAERFRVVHLDLADRRGIQHVNKPDLYDVTLFLRQWTGLLALLFRERPNLAHLTISENTIAFLRDGFLIWPTYWCGVKIIIHLHGGNFRNWYEGLGWVMKAYVKIVLKRVTQVIVLDESLKDVFRGLVPFEKISAVPNGIEWVDGKGSIHRPSYKRRYRVLHLSTLCRLKGALVLIAAIPLVLKNRQDVEFVLAGPWSHAEDQQEAESFIAQHGLAPYVTFTGEVDRGQKRALVESADLFVFPGVQQEGQPLVVIEAMAAGLPVLFTNRGCLRNTVVDGETGFEVNRNDPLHLADRILWLLDHPEVMREMGTKGRRRYEALYTRERFVKNMISIFSKVAEGRIRAVGGAISGVRTIKKM